MIKFLLFNYTTILSLGTIARKNINNIRLIAMWPGPLQRVGVKLTSYVAKSKAMLKKM